MAAVEAEHELVEIGLEVLAAQAVIGEHHKAWEAQAAAAGVGPFWSLAARPGYHLANVARSVPSSTRVRVCSSRCAPRDDHCICWRLAKRLPTTRLTVDSTKDVATRSP